MDEQPFLIPLDKDDRDAAEIQADRFLGCLLFGIVLITGIGVTMSGIFLSESSGQIFGGISVGATALGGLVIWWVFSPRLIALYVFSPIATIIALILYWVISAVFGT